MANCSICQGRLESIYYGSAIAYRCTQCNAFFDDNLSQKPLIQLIDEAEPEGQEVIKDVSRKCCLGITQFLKSRIDQKLVRYGVIPLIWGTTSRMLYSPLSDIDIVFIVPDDKKNVAKPIIDNFDTKIRSEEIRLKSLIDRTTFKKIPLSISQRKVPFSTMNITESKLKKEIIHGMSGKAKPFQPPQMILLSCSFPLQNEAGFDSLRKDLLRKYQHLADSHSVLWEHLASGLIAYNGLAHLYYGRKNHVARHSLPIYPPYLPQELTEAIFEEKGLPDFKSLDYREWQWMEGDPKGIDNGTKVIYRCVCDFLVSINIMCSGRCEDLFKYETFDILNEKWDFDQHQKNLFFLVQKWRLGVLPKNFVRLWQVAALVVKVFIDKVSKFELKDEVELAQKIFFGKDPIDYEV